MAAVLNTSSAGKASATRVLAGCFVFRRTRKGKIRWLLLHRRNKDVWEFPKGRIEDMHRDLITAAQQEAEEETGLAVHVLRHYGSFSATYTSRGGTRKRLWYVLGCANSSAYELSSEHDCAAWCKSTEVIQRLRWRAVAQQFRHALQRLQHQ